MLASYAKWERSTIRERTFSGKIKRAQQGKNPGFTPPYGYRRGEQPGEWGVDEEEAVAVRWIFRKYVAGKGTNSIAAGLNTCIPGVVPAIISGEEFEKAQQMRAGLGGFSEGREGPSQGDGGRPGR